MNRTELIAKLKTKFSIRELVCSHCYNSFGENAWQFFGTQELELLYLLRFEILCAGMVCNNYATGGSYSQRGLRCNICQIPRDKTLAGKIYLSAHCMGKAWDFTVTGMSAETARQKIEAAADRLPCPVRLEDDVMWLHVDTFVNSSGKKVYRFKV